MSDKEDAAFAEWAKEFEATHLGTDEEKTAFKALTSTKAGRELYRGHVREADYYRRLNEHSEEKKKFEADKTAFETDKGKMWNWWNETKPQVESLKQREAAAMAKLQALEAKLVADGVDVPNDLTAPAEAASGKARIEELEKRLLAAEQNRQLMDQALPKLLGDYGKVLTRAVKEGYEVDPSEVIAHAIKNNVDTISAFEALTAEPRQKRAEADFQKKLEAARAEGAREAMAKASTPSRVGLSSPAANDSLARLFSKEDKKVSGTERRQAGIEAIRAVVDEATASGA